MAPTPPKRAGEPGGLSAAGAEMCGSKLPHSRESAARPDAGRRRWEISSVGGKSVKTLDAPPTLHPLDSPAWRCYSDLI